MSDYSSNFPTQSPTFAFDAKAGKLDSRISYSRSSGGTYLSNEKSLNSENLLLQSQDLDTTWTNDGSVGIASVTGGQTAPDGTSTAWLLTTATFTGGSARIQQSIPISTNTEYTMVAHVKAGTASHAFISFRGASTQSCSVTLNFSTQALTNTAFSFTNVSSSVTALGSSWFKLTLTGTTDNSTANPNVRIGISDGSAVAANGNPSWNASGETMYAWGAQLSSTNSKVYDSPTTTQISREYSPLLKTASADSPRFEYDASGNSEGLLIEAQATNLLTYSEDWTNSDFTKFVAITSNAGIAPTGELAADLVTATSSTGDHLTRQSLTIVSGQTYTMSVFAKASGCNFVRIGGASTAAMPAQASFNLANGTVGTVDYGTAQIEDVGNGYYRCSVTGTAASSSSTHFQVRLMQSDNTPSWTGDDYSGVLLFGQMAEQSSSASSYIKTTSSSVSRAADSCSVVDASLFDNGGGTIYAEVTPNNLGSTFSGIASINAGGLSDRVELVFNNTAARATIVSDGITYSTLSGGSYTAGDPIKSCLTYATNSVSYYVNGSEIGSTDTSSVIPVINTLSVGNTATGSWPLNGHLKRVAVYSDSISETSAAALTS